MTECSVAEAAVGCPSVSSIYDGDDLDNRAVDRGSKHICQGPLQLFPVNSRGGVTKTILPAVTLHVAS